MVWLILEVQIHENGVLMILALVDDLFFSAKLAEGAKQAGITLKTVGTRQAVFENLKQGSVAGLIFDLDCGSTDAVELIGSLKTSPDAKARPLPPMVAFVRHTHEDRIRQAEAAGCDQILPRSSFFRDLPGLLGSFPSKTLTRP